ncbi:MAG: ankyrin repeat domain-containing protein [Paracoccaceae bacterium]
MTPEDQHRFAALQKHLANLSPQQIEEQRAKLSSPERLFDLVRQGDAVAVAQAVKDGADLTIKDERGMTPLHHAAALDARLITQAILHEPSVSVWTRDKQGRLPGDIAVESGHREMTDTLMCATYPDLYRDDLGGKAMSNELIDRYADEVSRLGQRDTRSPYMTDFEPRGFLPGRSGPDRDKDRGRGL